MAKRTLRDYISNKSCTRWLPSKAGKKTFLSSSLINSTWLTHREHKDPRCTQSLSLLRWIDRKSFTKHWHIFRTSKINSITMSSAIDIFTHRGSFDLSTRSVPALASYEKYVNHVQAINLTGHCLWFLRAVGILPQTATARYIAVGNTIWEWRSCLARTG